MNRIIYITAFLLALANSCASNEAEFAWTRTYTNWPYEESFYIYEGSATSGTAVFSMVGLSGDAQQVRTGTQCIAYGSYTVVMKDTYGDGWASGSSLVMTSTSTGTVTFHLSSGYQGTAALSVIVVYPYGSAWKTTNVAQTTDAWKTQSVTWTETNEFPVVSTITRYFRRSITPLNDVFGITMDVKTDCGYICYVNGVQVYSWNMPSGSVTPTTLALSQAATITPRSFGTTFAVASVITGNTVEVAIEVHAATSTPTGDESFDAFFILLSSRTRRIGSGTYGASHASGPGTEGIDKLFDDNTGTKWGFAHSTGTTWATWKFADGRKDLINKYSIASANDMPGRDPKDWKIYGSNDEGITWSVLDAQNGVTFSARYQTKYFGMPFQTTMYNMFKWEITAKYSSSADMEQASEWGLFIEDYPLVPVGINYEQPSYTLTATITEANIRPTVLGGFKDWSVTGGTLPTGLTLDPATGVITGIVTGGAGGTLTISAVFLSTEVTYTGTVNLIVNTCDLPSKVVVKFVKSSSTDSESYTVFDSANQAVLTYTSTNPSTIRICLPVGMYTVKSYSTTGGLWAIGSSLRVTSTLDDDNVVLVDSRMLIETEDSYLLNLNYPVVPARYNNGIKYILGSVPANWYTAGFDASSWTTLNGVTRPATTEKIQLFRTTFSIASLTNIHGIEFRMKSRAGIVIYVNGNEIYRRYLDNGDISSTSTATGGDTAFSYKSIVVGVDKVTTGTNTLAVGLVLAASPTSVEFDMSVGLKASTNKFPRYFDATGTNAQLFGQNKNNYGLFERTENPVQSVILTLSNNRAEVFNKYCFVTSSQDANGDPKSWEILGSNDAVVYTSIKNVTNFLFSERLATSCFYMSGNTVAYTYYKLTMKEARSSDTAIPYTLSQWNLYLEDLNSLDVPDLTFTPNTVTAFTGESFPTITANSPVYTGFVIVPDLPTGLTMNGANGVIIGASSVSVIGATYTVSAYNHMDIQKSTTITITIEKCTNDKIAFTIDFVMAANGYYCGFQLKEKVSGTLIESRTTLTSSATTTLHFCRPATTYTVVLTSLYTYGWGASKFNVILADGTTLVSESLAAGYTEKGYDFNPSYAVEPLFGQWHYHVAGGAAPSEWNTVAGAPDAWSVGSPTEFPVATGVAQYYYKKFEVLEADLPLFSTLDISVTFKAGAMVYLNGKLIRSINMPTGVITYNTEATMNEMSPTRASTSELVQRGRVVAGTNIIAIELHRCETNEVSNSFDGSAIFIQDNMYTILNGAGSTVPEKSGSEGSDKLFDNNSSTKYLASGTETIVCEGLTMKWSYEGYRQTINTNIGLVSANDCLVRSPTTWKLEGSNDDVKYTLLTEKRNKFFTDYYEQMRYDFYNQDPYKHYRVTALECINPKGSGVDSIETCGNARVQLSELYFFAKRLDPDALCPAIGDFHPAVDGDISQAECPQLYEGSRIRRCNGTTFGEEVISCTPAAPAGISYSNNTIVVYIGKLMTPTIPNIVGAEYTVSVFPKLPPGLTLNDKTGEISGTPTELSESSYVVTVNNKGGLARTTITISVIKVPINWLLIGILIAVAVILIVVVIVVLVMSCKKKKPAGKKSVTKAPSKAPAKAAPVKTKAAVKV